MRRLLLLVCAAWLTSVPALAQVDLNGSWASRLHEDYIERGPGSDLADFTGVPLNDEARAKALMYDATIPSMQERQCLPMSPWSILYRPLPIRIWSETDASGGVVSWNIGGDLLRDIMTIWMDGRPHPSANAFHGFSGFTTGRWQGDTLVTRTTHMKTTTLRRGNGIPSSDRATVTTYITRNDDLLTILAIHEDPVYLTQPHVVSRVWQLNPAGNVARSNICTAVTEIPRLEDSGIVPHLMPGDNPAADFIPRTYNVPLDAAMGRAETLYPEYRKTLRGKYVIPVGTCGRYCCGWIEAQGRPESAPNLSCLTDGSGRVGN
jgi:hypothetical protein